MTTAAKTEFPAAVRFSARINSADGMAGLPDMLALSLLGTKYVKQRNHLIIDHRIIDSMI
jgi:hypothetical protein